VLSRRGNDPLSDVRAFFAVDLTSEVRGRIARVLSSARALLADEPVRWVRLEILHLTLRFLGETAPVTLEEIRRAASERAVSWRPFELEVKGLGCFPDLRRPRVIWVGANPVSGELQTIAQDLERIAREAGFAAEERPFSPHLTVGRIKDRLSAEGGRRLAEFLDRSASEPLGIVPVRSIDLLKSDLKPPGPIYTRLARLALGG
jgi:2'-5' RNA ligase